MGAMRGVGAGAGVGVRVEGEMVVEELREGY